MRSRLRCLPSGASWPRSVPACSSWRRPAWPAPTRTSSRSSTPPAPAPSWVPLLSWRLRSRWCSRPTPRWARELARRYASIYLSLPNYTQNLRTFGFGDDDIDGGGSDRLIDAVIPWGDAETVAAAIRAHQDAGADHVCIQVVADGPDFPLDGYRELAAALFGG